VEAVKTRGRKWFDEEYDEWAKSFVHRNGRALTKEDIIAELERLGVSYYYFQSQFQVKIITPH